MSLEAPPPRYIPSAALVPGDVLLMGGHGDISQSIARLDGSKYSHAALSFGGELAIEAKLPAVKAKPLAVVLEDRPFVDVFRYRRSNQLEMAGLVRAARSYEAAGYSGGTLLLNFALVAVLGHAGPQAQDALSALVAKLLAQREVRRGMETLTLTCTELVARTYADAGAPLAIVQPDDRRANMDAFLAGLRGLWTHRQTGLLPGTLSPQLGAGSTPAFIPESLTSEALDWEALLEGPLAGDGVVRLVEYVKGELWEPGSISLDASAPSVVSNPSMIWQPPRLSVQEMVVPESIAARAGLDWPCALITPRMLAESPDLEYVGSLAV